MSDFREYVDELIDKICKAMTCTVEEVQMGMDAEFDDVEDGEEFDCPMDEDGICDEVGTEYCDFECPFRDEEDDDEDGGRGKRKPKPGPVLVS